MWQIEKVSYERNDGPMQMGAALTSPPPPAGSEAPAKPESAADKVKIAVRDAQSARAPSPDDANAGNSDLRRGVADGSSDGVADGTGNDPNAVIGDIGCGAGKVLCSGKATTPPPETKRKKPDETRVVRSTLIDGKRYRGNTQIQPPDSVKTAMSRAGDDRVRAIIKMCLSKTGDVASVDLLLSTGYPDYDRKLLGQVRTWRYHPYKLDSGQAVPVCTSIVFKYSVPTQ
jgi:outer membrane biosynthesis protein TonB